MVSEPKPTGWCLRHGPVAVDEYGQCLAIAIATEECLRVSVGPGADAALALAREVEGLRAKLAEVRAEVVRMDLRSGSNIGPNTFTGRLLEILDRKETHGR